jgi:hypothetical protein
VPTLVADGTDDQLDAVANDRAIADRIPGAKLLLYPDAGHGFLFQEGTPFAVEVGSFLAGPAAPDGTDQLRQVFAADESRVVAAGRALGSRLHAMDPATATTPEVAVIDLPYVAALDRLDDDLLTAGARGACSLTLSGSCRPTRNSPPTSPRSPSNQPRRCHAGRRGPRQTRPPRPAQATRSAQHSACPHRAGAGYNPRPGGLPIAIPACLK